MGYLDNDFRQIFRNMLWPERIRNLNVEQWVDYCAKVGATSVCIDMKAQVYAEYSSALIEKNPLLGSRDLGAEVSEATSKRRLKWCAYIAPSELECLSDTCMEWECRSEDGSIPRRQANGSIKTCFCWNSPYREFLASILKEIAEKYKPHGFYMDGMGFRMTCHCKYCKARFLKEYGLPLPTAKDLDATDSKTWALFIKARKLWVGDAARVLRTAVHAVDSNISFFVNNRFGGENLGSCGPELASQFVLSHEASPCTVHSDGRPYGFSVGDAFMWNCGIQRAAQKGKTCQVYLYLTPVTRLDDMNLFADLACAAGAQLTIQEHRSDMKPFMSRIEDMEPWLKDVTPLTDITVHYSEAAHVAYYKPYKNKISLEDLFTHNVDAFHKEARGLFKAIVDTHRPVELLVDKDLGIGDYRHSKLLILPNSAVLTDESSSHIKSHLEHGGAVITSMLTGTMNEFGDTVTDELIMSGSGLKTVGTLKTRKPFCMTSDNGKIVMEEPISADPAQYLVFKEGTVKDWLGEDIAVHEHPEPMEDREIFQLRGEPSMFLPPDANVPPAKDSVLRVAADEKWTVLAAVKYRDAESGEWQESPAILERSVGKGRMIYIAFQLGAFLLTHRTMSWDIGYVWGRRLLLHLIDRAIGPSRIRIDAPACVKATFWKQGEKTLIHLVNELSSLSPDLQIEERLPVAIKVSIPDAGCNSVKVGVGRKGCRITKTDGGWTISCPAFKERMLIVCE